MHVVHKSRIKKIKKLSFCRFSMFCVLCMSAILCVCVCVCVCVSLAVIICPDISRIYFQRWRNNGRYTNIFPQGEWRGNGGIAGGGERQGKREGGGELRGDIRYIIAIRKKLQISHRISNVFVCFETGVGVFIGISGGMILLINHSINDYQQQLIAQP